MTKEDFVHSFQVMAEFQEGMQNPEAQTICIDYCRKMELCWGKKIMRQKLGHSTGMMWSRDVFMMVRILIIH